MLKREQYKKAVSYEDVYKKAIEVFNFDKDKALKWYLSKLPDQDLSPYELCKKGGAPKLLNMLDRIVIAR